MEEDMPTREMVEATECGTPVTELRRVCEACARERRSVAIHAGTCGKSEEAQNGTVISRVRLYLVRALSPVRKAQPEVSVLTMEPDGTLSCLRKDAA